MDGAEPLSGMLSPADIAVGGAPEAGPEAGGSPVTIRESGWTVTASLPGRTQRQEWATLAFMSKHKHHASTEPQDYPRRILLAATGLSPQVVTETLYALAVAGRPAFLPTEVHLITTKEGKRNAELSLLAGHAWLSRLCDEYDLPPIAFSPDNIYVIGGSDPLTDIRTARDNDIAADYIAEQVRTLTSDQNAALHVSIAGGRKTMGFYTGYALSLYGRAQDRLSHVLVSAPYESLPDFFYPARKRRVIYDRDNRPHDASQATVTLAAIPFVQLREGLPEGLLNGTESFVNTVKAAQRAVGPPELVIDLTGKRIRAGGKVVKLPPTQLALLTWLARRRIHGEDGVTCPSEGAPETDYRDEYLAEHRAMRGEWKPSAPRLPRLRYLAEYRAIFGGRDDENCTSKRLAKGLSHDFFSETKSKLNRRLREVLNPALGRTRAAAYEIVATGPRGSQRFGIDLPASAIRFDALDPTDDSDSRGGNLAT